MKYLFTLRFGLVLALFGSLGLNAQSITIYFTTIPGCTGNNALNVPFVASGFGAGNVFTAELSDAMGSFANPLDIGTVSGTANGVINAMIPFNLVQGSSYMVRIRSSNPVAYSNLTPLLAQCLPQTCNANPTLTASSGVLSDGSGLANYANGLNCSWLIQPSTPGPILISWNSFNTQAWSDYVYLHDGTSAGAPIIGSYSGTILPASVTANSGSVFVRFVTNSSVNAAGWELSYSVQSTTPSPTCTDPFSADVIVVENPFCQGDMATVRAAASGGGSSKTYLWSDGSTARFATLAPGTHWVEVSAGNCTAYDTVVISNPTNSDESVVLNPVTKNGAQQFVVSWTAAALNENESLIGYRVAYRLRGTTSFSQLPLTTALSATVDFTGLGLCNGNYEFTVYTRFNRAGTNITSAPACLQAKGYSGGTCKSEGSPAEASETATPLVSIYPNPNNGSFAVRAPQGTQISLYNLQGRVLYTGTTQDTETPVAAQGLSTGVYLLHSVQPQGQRQTERIIIH
ncbi:T9SS type A sorting domain-containing protein [bacterium]|nr:T9SS type A sorting domain-containing protein [bacterium]